MILKGFILSFLYLFLAVVQGYSPTYSAVTQEGKEQHLDIPSGREILLLAKTTCPASSTKADIQYNGLPSIIRHFFASLLFIGNSSFSLNRCGLEYVTHITLPSSAQKFKLTFCDPTGEFADVEETIEYFDLDAFSVTVSSDGPLSWTVCASSDVSCWATRFASPCAESNSDDQSEESICPDYVEMILAISLPNAFLFLVNLGILAFSLKKKFSRAYPTVPPRVSQDHQEDRGQAKQMAFVEGDNNYIFPIGHQSATRNEIQEVPSASAQPPNVRPVQAEIYSARDEYVELPQLLASLREDNRPGQEESSVDPIYMNVGRQSPDHEYQNI